MRKIKDIFYLILLLIFSASGFGITDHLEGIDESNIFKNKFWTKQAELPGPNGYTYYFMNFSVLQGQEMKLVRSRDPDHPEKDYEDLGSTNGDSPRSWASIIRPQGAPDEDYGQLYCAPEEMILGIRHDNHCFLAYNIKSGEFWGHGKIESISPFLLIQKETKLHEPDVLGMLLEVIRHTDFREGRVMDTAQGPGCPGPAAFTEGLSHPNKEIQRLSKWCRSIQQDGLSMSNDTVHEIIDYLLEALQSKNMNSRICALNTFGFFKIPYVDKAMPYLETAVQDSNAEIASKAAYSLGEMGEKAFPILLRCLKSKNSSVRFYGMYGFRIAGSSSQACIKEIMPLLADGDSGVRRQTLIALESIQYTGSDLVPYLEKLLNDNDEWIRRDADNLLKKVKSIN